MIGIAAPVGETTDLALKEKRKLHGSLSGFDVVLFTLRAFAGLDTPSRVAAAGPQG